MKTKKNLKLFRILTLFFLISCIIIPISCGKSFDRQTVLDIDPYYIYGLKEDRQVILDLFSLLIREKAGSEGEFAVTREIAANFVRHGDYDRLIQFLSSRTIKNPADPYNGYYFLMIAYAHLQQGSKPIAALYFDLIINNYPDLIINDESIHLVCLQNLISININPERRAWYYSELISRFPGKIDLGTGYFMLGQACEDIGDWNGAIRAYTNFLPFSTGRVPDYPEAARYARQQVDFSRSTKDWTFESLPALRAAIEAALDDGNSRALIQYQAKVNFFARSWGQMETDETGLSRFNLAQFVYGSRIKYETELDDSSNYTEAFLRTTGWALGLNTWYLYFRKIYFPQDPEIHGRWEWAGIYYGEKF